MIESPENSSRNGLITKVKSVMGTFGIYDVRMADQICEDLFGCSHAVFHGAQWTGEFNSQLRTMSIEQAKS